MEKYHQQLIKNALFSLFLLSAVWNIGYGQTYSKVFTVDSDTLVKSIMRPLTKKYQRKVENRLKTKEQALTQAMYNHMNTTICFPSQKALEVRIKELTDMQDDFRAATREYQVFMFTLDSILSIEATEYINSTFIKHPNVKPIDQLVDKSLILYAKSPALDLTDFFLEKLKEQPFKFDKATQEYIDQLFQSIKESKLQLKD